MHPFKVYGVLAHLYVFPALQNARALQFEGPLQPNRTLPKPVNDLPTRIVVGH